MSKVKVTRCLEVRPLCLRILEGFGGKQYITLLCFTRSAIGIHTWAVSIPKTEVAGDSYCKYKDSRKQLVFWDTNQRSGQCVDFID